MKILLPVTSARKGAKSAMLQVNIANSIQVVICSCLPKDSGPDWNQLYTTKDTHRYGKRLESVYSMFNHLNLSVNKCI